MNKLCARIVQYFGPEAGELSAVAGRCRQLWPEDTALILRTAEDLSAGRFLFQLPWDMEQTQEAVDYGRDLRWDEIHFEDPEFVFQQVRQRYWVCLGQAYILTGERRFVATFLTQFRSWCQEQGEGPQASPLTWRSLDAGLRMLYWPRAIALMAGALEHEAEFWSLLEEQLEGHLRLLRDNPRRAFSLKSNWGVMEFAGLYVLALVLGREEERRLAAELLDRMLRIQILPDGQQWEASPMYHHEVLMAALEVWGLSRQAGHAEDFGQGFAKQLVAMLSSSAQLLRPDGRQLLYGDSDDTELGALLTEGAWLMDWPDLARAQGLESLGFEALWRYGLRAAEGYAQLRSRRGGPAVLQSEEFWPVEASSGWTSFPDSGHAVYRSAEQNAAGQARLWMHLASGPIGGGHGHVDRLHLDCYWSGQTLLSDAGRGSYRETELRYRLKSAAAHNVPSVQGRPGLKSLHSWELDGRPEALPAQHAAVASYFYWQGQSLDWAPGLCRRRVLGLSPTAQGQGYWLVSDRLLGSAEDVRLQVPYHFWTDLDLEALPAGAWLVRLPSGERIFIQAFCRGKALVGKQVESLLSKHYNQVESRPCLCFEGLAVDCFFVPVAADEALPEIVPTAVDCPAYSCQLPWEEATGYRLQLGSGQEEHIVLAEGDVANRRDYIGFAGHYGLGRVLAGSAEDQDLTRLLF